ncbi:hypothetical protein [Paenibacillus sp. HJGM_3]|uniref:hypothetical protein n=1 Tax=Paenibacillus sp. HJGM_3 TaxID=3379816 RepID=UPI00385C8F28
MELNNKGSRKFAAEARAEAPEAPADETFSFLALAEMRRQAAWKAEEEIYI